MGTTDTATEGAGAKKQSEATSSAAPASKKERSPNYPAAGLASAIRMAKKIYDLEKRSPMTPELAAKHIGYASMSGPARVAVSVLKKFGLLSEEGPKLVRLTEDAVKILVYPESSGERQQLLARAALKPEIYKDLVGKYGNNLASDDNMKGYLRADRGFSEAAAQAVIKGLRETVGIAKLDESSDTVTAEEMEQPSFQEPPDKKAAKLQSPPPLPPAARSPAGTPAYVLPLGADQTVSIYATSLMTKSHFDLLGKLLGLFKETAPDEFHKT